MIIMILFTGFKGRNNSSSLSAEQLSSEHLLLTNSFAGLKKDIGSIVKEYDFVVMFGVDTTLTSTVRIEKIASLDGIKLVSSLDLGWIADALNGAGLSAVKRRVGYAFEEIELLLLLQWSSYYGIHTFR